MRLQRQSARHRKLPKPAGVELSKHDPHPRQFVTIQERRERHTAIVRTLISWSSGKDSAWTLHALRHTPGIEIIGMVTTINEAFDRVAMHAVRRELVEAQAHAAALPLWPVPIPWPCSNADYEIQMRSLIAKARDHGVEAMAFGDLYLEDIRAYREKQLQDTGITPLFPLWMKPTRRLAEEMIAGGLKARLTCIDPRHLPQSFAGREFDLQLLHDLPPGIDPCGENGEFHTFCYAGPMFQNPIPIETGTTVERDNFVFTDLLRT